jgi:NADH-quinone oxidoreductase subunit A
MDTKLANDLIYVFGYAAVGLGFAFGPLLLVYLLAPRTLRQIAGKSAQPVECGMEPIGDAWVRYSAVYYLYSLVFVAFAVDVHLPHPGRAGLQPAQFPDPDLVELAIFVGILSLVIVYAWKKGVFEWTRKPAAPKSNLG